MKLAATAQEAGERTLRLHRLNIGPRLTVCFVVIILAMLLGNSVLLWQFYHARLQAERLTGVDQELIVVLQAHAHRSLERTIGGACVMVGESCRHHTLMTPIKVQVAGSLCGHRVRVLTPDIEFLPRHIGDGSAQA